MLLETLRKGILSGPERRRNPSGNKKSRNSSDGGDASPQRVAQAKRRAEYSMFWEL